MSFDFDAAVQVPFRMQPGLRRLAPGSRQLTPVVAPRRGVARHLREKLAVFGAFADEALLCRPGFDPLPALLALATQGADEHPEAIAFDGRCFEARGLGWACDVDGQVRQLRGSWPEIGPLLARLDPGWRFGALIALSFAEDFAIVDGRDGSIPWLAVALPSGWAPADKLGLSFAAVHEPIAERQRIVDAAPALTRLVTGEDRWERFVWTIAAHPRLHGHPRRVDPRRWPAEGDAEALGAQAWWRTERQTFVPLPALGQAVFTILVQVQRLDAALDDPQRAARVQAALASMSPAVLEYRGLTAARDRLLDWLARRAGR